jgi:PAS domain S-box-containing protein
MKISEHIDALQGEARLLAADTAETLRAIIETAGDAIVTANADGKIMSWNPAAERIFGYSQEEAIGEPITLIIPERFHAPHHEGIARVVATGKTKIVGSTVEVVGLRKDGSEFPVELTLGTWVTNDARFFSGILRDISEKADLISALGHSEDRLQAIVESANDAIITIDADGRVLLWNQHATKLFGYSSDEMIGQTLDVIIPERFREAHRERQRHVAEGGDTRVIGHTVELAALHRAGHEFPVELSLAMWESNGERFFSGIIRDITVRKEAEEVLRLAKERMEGELNVAAKIQMSMLPLEFPAFPSRQEFSVHAILKPAREVGGDFYDFFLIDDSHLCFCVADVSDKGVPAALFMAVTKTLIKAHASPDSSPATILTAVNDELCLRNESSMFVTLFLCILDLKSGLLTYTNAGHNPPYIKTNSGEVMALDNRHGLVAGVVPCVEYGEDRSQLNPGDYVVLFTDGVTEAMNSSHEFYSEEALESLLTKSTLASAEQATALIFASVSDHVGSAEQSDDITVLALEFTGGPTVGSGQGG